MTTYATDKRNYAGASSGCDLASTYLGEPSSCHGKCPFTWCIYDLPPGGAGSLARVVYRIVQNRKGAFKGLPIVVNKLTREVKLCRISAQRAIKS